ncbi:MAG: CapA family protein [Pirellulaceae bacterium]|nr:CapA family protein [Pirellulaceae bacterium]
MFLLHHVVTADEFDQKVRLLFVGDIMLDNGPGHLVSNGHDPFLPCADLLLSADLTIGNLECVVGKGGEQLDKPYTFRAASDSPRYLKKYFDALSLANNHSWDYGADGFSEALRVLKAERIAYFGGGNNLREARAPLVLECKGRKLGLLGYNEFRASNYAATDASAGNAPLDERSMISDIVSARKKFGCEIVIPFLHWGEELLAMPRKDQRELAEKLIDAGATAVIGAHPHVTQTIDIYRGAPIFYSLGNFVFDYFPGDPPEWIGWAVALEISGDGHVDFETTVVKLDPVGVPHLARQE